MTLAEEMSVPQWKLALLQKQQRKREEQERKAREEEEKRLAKLPPWKRHAEQPKTVIFIDKNKVANPVHLSDLSKTSDAPVANGNAPSIDTENEQFEIGIRGKTGDDDVDSGAPSGVSEEHCTTVQDNPFLKLEKKKRRAPPPPKAGSSINIIATNISVNSASTKATNSNKTISGASDSKNTNHMQQNGPLLGENQTKSSTKSLEKNSTGTNAQKTKSSVSKSLDSDNSTNTSLAKGAPLTMKIIRKSGDGSHSSEHVAEPESPRRKASIGELRSLFTRPEAPVPAQTVKTNNNNKTQSSKQAVSKIKISNGNSGLSDNKSVSQAKPKDPHTAAVSATVKSTNSSPLNKDASSASQKTSSVISENKKEDTSGSSKVKNEGKGLPDAQKAPLKKRPSESDMSASAIISLTNEGPLRKLEGHLKRSSSVFNDEEEISLESEESPRSATARRLQKYEESSKSTSKGTGSLANGSSGKRRAPSAPLAQNDKVGSRSSPAVATENMEEAKKVEEKPENTMTKKTGESHPKTEIAYPQNFRSPAYEPSEEEIPYPKDFRKPAGPPSQDKTSSQSEVKKSVIKEVSKTKNSDISTSKLSNSSETKESIKRTDGETKESKAKQDASSSQNIPYPSDFRKPTNQQTGTMGTLDTKSNQNEIPYPSDFRKPKGQASSKNSSGQKDIVKPSELINSSSSKDSTKDERANDSGPAAFLGFKLRKTKKPESSGITVVSSNDNSTKPTVDKTPNRGTSSLVAVGVGGIHTTTGKEKKKKATVKKFEKVEFIGYNSATNKPSALKSKGKNPKRNIKFAVKEEEVFEYMSEGASTILYDEMHKDDPKEEKNTKKAVPVGNGIKNGYMDSDEDEGDGGIKSNTPINKSSGFQNLAASNLSAMDMLLGRGPREEPKEPPKPAPPPEPEPEPESLSLKPEEGDLFSSAGQGTAALLF